MKQKYTITIADIEMNIITEATEEDVERIVGIIDRRMREISMKSKKCTKTEAALICALDLCAEKTELKAQVEELEDSLEERNEKFEHLCEKYELVQKNCDRLERERARLEVENSRLRAMLDDAAAGGAVMGSATDVAPEATPEADGEDTDEVAGAAPEAVSDDAPEASPVSADEADAASAPKKKGSSKSRVGAMFDLLTFTDI